MKNTQFFSKYKFQDQISDSDIDFIVQDFVTDFCNLCDWDIFISELTIRKFEQHLKEIETKFESLKNKLPILDWFVLDDITSIIYEVQCKNYLPE